VLEIEIKHFEQYWWICNIDRLGNYLLSYISVSKQPVGRKFLQVRKTFIYRELFIVKAAGQDD
jgi:hypothetical protein